MVVTRCEVGVLGGGVETGGGGMCEYRMSGGVCVC